jgi:membrane protein implicated in regulation of membrane protease activity
VAPTATGAAGSIRIEACVDGSDWLRIENGRLVHEHRGFAQIGAHPDCPAAHAFASGGLIVDGRPVSLAQLPYVVAIGSLDRFDVEQARGAVRLDGEKGLLLDDDGPGGPAVYVVRLHGGAVSAGASTPAQAAAKPATAAPPTILTGRWRTGCESDSDVYPVTIQQEGNRLSIVVEGQGRYQGTFDGRRLSGTSSDGLDRFAGEVVSANELRLDWEGRLSAGGQPFRNRCRLTRE